MSKPYREYSIITREQAFSRGFDLQWIVQGYDASVARQLLARYPLHQEVHFCRRGHNTCTTRYRPAIGVVIYVKSTGGHWSKSKRIIGGDTPQL